MKQIVWDKLYKENASKLKGVIRRYVGDDALAEDLVQDAFILAMSKADSFKGIGPIEGWLRRIAINNTLNYLKQKTPMVNIEHHLQEQAEESIEMEQGSTFRMRWAIEQASFSASDLLDVIDRLPENRRAVFNLHAIDGYKHHQIAELIHITQGTSKSHLSRARREVQAMLYERAIKQPNTSRRRAAWLLVFLPGRIDQLFKHAFSNYAPAVGLTPTFTQATSSLKPAFFQAVMSKITIYTMLAGGVGTTAWWFCSDDHFNSTISKPQTEAPNMKMIPCKTVIAQPVPQFADTATLLNEKNEKGEKLNQLSVQKKIQKEKTIIIHKTIVIRDTLLVETDSLF